MEKAKGATLVVGVWDAFACSVANQLATDRSVGLLAHTRPDSSLSSLDQRVRVFFGEPHNEQLVSNALNSLQATTIVYIPSDSHGSESVVEFARRQLLGVTHFLDGWRKADDFRQKTLIFVSNLSVYGEAHGDATHATRLTPDTEMGAALAGAEAMLHSYAVSYRLNINILRVPVEETAALALVIPAIDVLANRENGVAEIFHIPTNSATDFANEYIKKLVESPGWSEAVNSFRARPPLADKREFPAARFLVFGAGGWIGSQFVQLLESRHIEVVAAHTRPGSDADDVVAQEISQIAPSHVVSMLGRTHGPGCGNIDYLEGGPDKLQENVRDNLYAPWILANLCEKFGLHFTYLGTGCLYQYNQEHQRGGAGYSEDDKPTFIGNKYSVVKGFTDQAIALFSTTLNARIRLPVNDEDSPRNLLRKLIGFNKVLDIPNSITYLPECLQALLTLALRRETGTLNLVNPGPITFPRILEIYEQVTGQKLQYEVVPVEEGSAALQNRAHCTLDTNRLATLVPTISGIEEAMRTAVQNLSLHMTQHTH